MRIVFLFSFLLLNLVHYGQTSIEISNPSSIARKGEVVEIPWADVIKSFPGIDTWGFKVINSVSKKELEYQLEYKGEEHIQNLLIQVNIPAKGKMRLQLVKGKHKPFMAKTFCRFVPERKDDFAWENDKIAFRMYGKALEKTPNEMAYGIDVWVKRTKELIINDWYKRNDYHQDNGQGMDYYKVGLTLGAGDAAPFINDTIWFPKNYTQWKVLDNGPLRSTFQLSYDEWTAAGKKLKAVKTISLDAGSQLGKIEVNYEMGDGDPLPVATGIVKRNEPGEMLLNEKDGIMGYWEPQHGKDGTTGLGCIFTRPVSEMMITQNHLLTETIVARPFSIIYYQGAVWDKAGIITSAKKWFSYLETFGQKLKQPVLVVIHN